MKIYGYENSIKITDKPFLRWIIGTFVLAILLFFAFLFFFVVKSNAPVADLVSGVILTGLSYLGFRQIRLYYFTESLFDWKEKTFTHKTFLPWKRSERVYSFSRILKAVVVEKDSNLAENGLTLSRVVIVFRDETQLPLTSSWRYNGDLDVGLKDKLNTIFKENKGKK